MPRPVSFLPHIAAEHCATFLNEVVAARLHDAVFATIRIWRERDEAVDQTGPHNGSLSARANARDMTNFTSPVPTSTAYMAPLPKQPPRTSGFDLISAYYFYRMIWR